MRSERSTLAPLVVAILLAAVLIVGTMVGGIMACRLFAPVPHILPSAHGPGADDIIPVDDSSNAAPDDLKPEN